MAASIHRDHLGGSSHERGRLNPLKLVEEEGAELRLEADSRSG
jgi:hypothetical protein